MKQKNCLLTESNCQIKVQRSFWNAVERMPEQTIKSPIYKGAHNVSFN